MIEVNEYVRTKDGEIHKVIEIKENRYITNFDDYFYYRYDNNMGGFKSNIAKHSKQLIDLIEVGDIVNKELVIDIIDIANDKEEIIGRKLITQYRSAQFTGLDIKHYIYANDIKTILTKESYMANCYKVGGEE
jgi:hypothetical protein